MMKKVTILLGYLLCCLVSFAQKDTLKTDTTRIKPILSLSEQYKKYLPNFSPLSPSAAGIQKFGDFQVNMATGTIDNSILIHTVSDGGLAIPIYLRSNTGGHRMDDFASWVGWGMSLDLGATMNRSIRALADDKPTSGNYLSNPVIARNLCDSGTDYSFVNNVQNNTADLEPDLFSYSTNQVGGKFMLRPNSSESFLIPYQAVQITRTTETNGEIKSLKVVNPDGTAYVFGKASTGEGANEYQSIISESTGEVTSNGTVTWHLAQIQSPNTNDKISCFYQEGGDFIQTNQSWSASLTFDQSNTPTTYFIQPQPNRQIRKVVQKNIKKIAFTNGKIEFEQSINPRNDQSDSYSLDKIKVYGVENGDTVLQKSIVFRYSYFKDRLNQDARLKLDKVVFYNATNTDSLVYGFEYTTNSFSYSYPSGNVQPNDDWKKQDYFGFYNGKSNGHLFDIATYSGATFQSGAADRSTDETLMKEGVLSKITYPTGGFSLFEYEANRYKNTATNTAVMGAGLRIKTIKNYTSVGNRATIKRYEYSSDDGAGVGKLNVSWSFPTSANVGQNSFVNGTFIYQTHYLGTNGLAEMSTHDGTQVFYTTVNEFVDSTGQANGYSAYEFSHEADIIVNTPNMLIRDIEPWKRGLLLSRKSYNSSNVLLESVINQYAELKKDTTTNEGKVYKINEANGACATCTSGMPYGFIIPNGRMAFPNNPMGTPCDKPMYVYLKAQSKTGQMKLIQSISILDSVSSTTNYHYNDYLMNDTTITSDSYTNHFKQSMSIYPTHASYDFDAEVLEMRNRNMIGIPLESIEKEDLNGTINTLFKQKTVYERVSGSNTRGFTQNLLPKEIFVAPTGGTLEKRVEYTVYDSDGNPTEYKVDGIPTALVWGYGGSLLLGQIQNATISAVNAALSTTGVSTGAYSLTNLSTIQLDNLKAFRKLLPNSLVTWYTYRPHIGMSSSIAPNGLRSSIEYDAFTRLANTKDHDDNKLTEYSYYYGNPNRITTTQYRVDKNGFLSPNISEIVYPLSNLVSHDYFDGLGRFIQKVGERRSPSVKDIVYGTQTYDTYGRAKEQITIFPSDKSDGTYQANGLNLAQAFYGDSRPYSVNFYESSPLNRSREMFGVGNAWYSANKKARMFDESAGAAIRYYTIDANGNINLSGFYPSKSLFQKRSLDEQGNATIEITDKRGRLIQRQQQHGTDWLTTYYINDGLGRVLAILQPNAYALNGSISQSSTDWSNGVFYYQYDTRGRANEKYVPNGGFSRMVYDNADREVFSQDAHQQTLKKWSFTKYDGLSRAVLSGEMVKDSSRALLQSLFDAQGIISETFDSTLTQQLYYTNVSFPFGVDSSQAMEVNFYDTYSGWRDAFHGSFSSTPYESAKGLLTGVKKRYTETRQWLTQAMYYDKKNRMIYSRKDYLNDNIPYPEVHNYFFSGELLLSDKFFGSSNIYRSYNYDFAGRKEQSFIYLGNKSSATIKYGYNEIGQLASKKIQPDRQYTVSDTGADYIYRPPAVEQANTQDIANKAVIISPPFSAVASDVAVESYLAEIDTVKSNGLTDAMQTINYGYHIRGQVNCMNCRNKQVRIGNKQNDLFAMRLDFEEDKRYFDGNISRQTWKNTLIANAQQYKHSYDGASRLVKSLYSGGVSGTNYSLDSVAYDRNGNIQLLKRHVIDNLSYAYNGNQLLSVTDNGGTTAGFTDGNTAGNDYGYWANGSLKFDKNKGIDSIVYNSYLKKVSRVKWANGNWVNFFYDGSGTLLKRKLSSGDTWVYQDEIIYKNNKYYQLNHDEGRAIYDTVANKWRFEFEYRDILGNLRVAFRDSLAEPVNGVYAPPVVTQIDEIDPTGLSLSSLNYAGVNKNNFGFINRETFTETGWINLNNRFYMPDLMRFGQTDPITEGQEHLSLYQYGWNNPVRFSDPNGTCPVEPCNDGIGTVMSAYNKDFQRDLRALPAKILGFTDVNDATVLTTMFTRGSNAVNIDGSKATTSDKFFAGAGALLPLVSGSAVKKVVGAVADKVADVLKIDVSDANKIDRNLLNPPSKHGNAPTFKKDDSKVEIHHEGQNPNGPFKEMHKTDHRGKGNDAINHPNKSKPSQVDRKEFDKARKEYWKEQYPKQ
jgi:RHS repeat-associated protein